jgi:acyl carrier protein
VVPLAPPDNLALLDASMARSEPALVPARFDTAALRSQLDPLSPLFRALIRSTARRSAPSSADRAASLKQRLATASNPERDRILGDLVRAEVAAVLGLASIATVLPGRPLREIGLDSLTAVELRNRLGATTGLRLPATLAFDHPTPTAIATRLRTELHEDAALSRSALTELDRLDDVLAAIPLDDRARPGITVRLRALLSKWSAAEHPTPERAAPALAATTNDELFALIDDELADLEIEP